MHPVLGLLCSFLGLMHFKQIPLSHRHACPANDGIHLAVSPKCGFLSGNVTDVNAGLDLGAYETIVSFGDSYTDGGRHDGGPLAPPVIIPPNAQAGGRSTDGPVWIEYVANDIGAKFMDYAQSGACTDLQLWPSNPKKVDFLGQMNTFLSQNNSLEPDSTLYTIFFGINDYIASLTDGDHLPQAAQVVLDQISILASPPTLARSFLIADVYGRGTHTPAGEAWKQKIFDGLHAFHANETLRLQVAYADFSRIWDGVLDGPPGYKAFGYTNTSSCVIGDGTSTIGSCDDPEHYFYWIPGHPSTQGMRIMADYVEEVLSFC